MAEPAKVSSMVAGKSDAEVEELLDRMLTRLALCDDSKLEPLLSKLLPLCISSLSSNSAAVRNKVETQESVRVMEAGADILGYVPGLLVLEILSHVNKRVKLQPDIGLPLSELWELYSESGATPIIRNFCIVYIEMAFQRVSAKVHHPVLDILKS
ncbi:uncharacterized protein DS421_7g203790 [Arachis hypogaea]|nr:uncharacterized protein DS421_7g203790 [Arachis hypogaea]